MKEIRQNLKKRELALILKQSRNQGIDFYLLKSIEIKNSFFSSICVDYLDVYFG
jgi:hypothetical protein